MCADFPKSDTVGEPIFDFSSLRDSFFLDVAAGWEQPNLPPHQETFARRRRCRGVKSEFASSIKSGMVTPQQGVPGDSRNPGSDVANSLIAVCFATSERKPLAAARGFRSERAKKAAIKLLARSE